MINLRKNIIYNIVYQILLLIIPLITTPYIARVVGVNGVGIYSYTYSIIQYFVLFIMLGLNNYGNRAIAKSNNDINKMSDTFWNIYYMQIICFTVVTIMFIVFMIFTSGTYKNILIIEYVFIVAAAFDINWFFFGMEKFKIIVIRNLVIKTITLFSIFLLVKKADDLIIYVIIMSVSTFISNIVLWPHIFKNLIIKKPNLKQIIKHFKGNIILFIPVIAISVYNIMDKIMIGYLVNVYNVGLYENAEKIVNIPLNIITSVGTVMMPRVSNLLSNGKINDLKRITKRTFIVLMFFTFPMMFGLIGISNNLVLIYLGNDFKGSITFVKLLCIIIFFKVLGNIIRTQYLIPYEKDKIYIKSVIFGAIINIILNVLLIFRYGAIGAVIGTICAEVFVSVFQLISIQSEFDLKKIFIQTIPFFVSSLIMFVIVCLINYMQIDSILIKIFVQVFIGCFIYIILNIKFIKNNYILLK